MTTRISKPVRRELPASSYFPRTEGVIASMTPEGVYVRPKGRRKAYLLPWGRLIHAAVDLEARRIIAERKAARAARGKSKAK